MINRLSVLFFFFIIIIHFFILIKKDPIQHSHFMHWFCLAPNLEKQSLQQNYNIMVNILNQSDEFK